MKGHGHDMREGGNMMNEIYNKQSPIAAKAEGVVLLPGRPAWGMVVTVALAQTTVLSLSDCQQLEKGK